MEGYGDNDKFIFIERTDYERWIAQGGEAYHVGDENFGNGGADNKDDRYNQMSDMIVHLLHFGRLNGLFTNLDDVFGSVRTHFEAENPKRLRPWMRDLREEWGGRK